MKNTKNVSIICNTGLASGTVSLGDLSISSVAVKKVSRARVNSLYLLYGVLETLVVNEDVKKPTNQPTNQPTLKRQIGRLTNKTITVCVTTVHVTAKPKLTVPILAGSSSGGGSCSVSDSGECVRVCVIPCWLNIRPCTGKQMPFTILKTEQRVCVCVGRALFVCLFDFFTSSSTTRLYRGHFKAAVLTTLPSSSQGYAKNPSYNYILTYRMNCVFLLLRLMPSPLKHSFNPLLAGTSLSDITLSSRLTQSLHDRPTLGCSAPRPSPCMETLWLFNSSWPAHRDPSHEDRFTQKRLIHDRRPVL